MTSTFATDLDFAGSVMCWKRSRIELPVCPALSVKIAVFDSLPIQNIYKNNDVAHLLPFCAFSIILLKIIFSSFFLIQQKSFFYKFCYAIATTKVNVMKYQAVWLIAVSITENKANKLVFTL